MNLEKKRDEEIRRRQGMTGRTILMLFIFAVAGVIAYFLTNYMFANDIITYGMFYDGFSVTRADVPEWVFTALVAFLLVMVMMFFAFIGFAFASPEGRRKTGKPTMYSRNKDPLDNPFEN